MMARPAPIRNQPVPQRRKKKKKSRAHSPPFHSIGYPGAMSAGKCSTPLGIEELLVRGADGGAHAGGGPPAERDPDPSPPPHSRSAHAGTHPPPPPAGARAQVLRMWLTTFWGVLLAVLKASCVTPRSTCPDLLWKGLGGGGGRRGMAQGGGGHLSHPWRKRRLRTMLNPCAMILGLVGAQKTDTAVWKHRLLVKRRGRGAPMVKHT